MNQLFSRSSSLLLLMSLCIFAVGCTIESADAAQPQPTRVPPPKCQQDNKTRQIGTRFLFNENENHYAHVVADPSDKRHLRVLTDGVFVRERFDFDSVGPLVYNPTGERFALIAAKSGQKYILEYASGGETPYIAEPIEDAWNNWVCFGARGKNLFAIAKYNRQWHLFARAEKPGAPFLRFPLNGDPSNLELLPARDGNEGFQYEVESGQLQMEIKSWLK